MIQMPCSQQFFVGDNGRIANRIKALSSILQRDHGVDTSRVGMFFESWYASEELLQLLVFGSPIILYVGAGIILKKILSRIYLGKYEHWKNWL